jgi:hypothetical protein
MVIGGISMEDETAILTEEELEDALRSIFKRSQTDMEFRKLCLSNPAEAVRKVSGKSPPEGVKLKFLDTGMESPKAEDEEPT